MKPEELEELLMGPVEKAPDRLKKKVIARANAGPTPAGKLHKSRMGGIFTVAASLLICGIVLSVILFPPSDPVTTPTSPQEDRIKELIAKLKDGNEYVEANNVIVDKLVAIGGKCIEPLIREIQATDSNRRAYSAWALAMVLEVSKDKDNRGRMALVACLGDADFLVRLLAASGLGLLKDRRTVFALIINFDPTLDSFSSTLRKTTRESFKTRKEWLTWWAKHESEYPGQIVESTETLVRRLRDGNDHTEKNNRIVDRLVGRGDTSIPHLIKAIRDAKFEGRGYAAWGLSECLKAAKDEGGLGITALLQCLKDSDVFVRVLASSGLRVLQDRRTLHELIRNFDPKDHTGDALRAITGESFDSKEDWRTWWQKNKSDYPKQIVLEKEN